MKQVEAAKAVLPEKPCCTGRSNHDQLMDIQQRFNFSAEELAEITKKKKVETVKEWLKPDGQDIPDKALRMLTKYVQGKPRLMAVGS